MIKSWDRLVVRFALPDKVIHSVHLHCEFLLSLLKMDFEQTLFKIHFKRTVRFLNTLKVQLGHILSDGPRGRRVFRVLGLQTPSPGNPMSHSLCKPQPSGGIWPSSFHGPPPSGLPRALLVPAAQLALLSQMFRPGQASVTSLWIAEIPENISSSVIVSVSCWSLSTPLHVWG